VQERGVLAGEPTASEGEHAAVGQLDAVLRLVGMAQLGSARGGLNLPARGLTTEQGGAVQVERVPDRADGLGGLPRGGQGVGGQPGQVFGLGLGLRGLDTLAGQPVDRAPTAAATTTKVIRPTTSTA